MCVGNMLAQKVVHYVVYNINYIYIPISLKYIPYVRVYVPAIYTYVNAWIFIHVRICVVCCGIMDNSNCVTQEKRLGILNRCFWLVSGNFPLLRHRIYIHVST